MPNPNIYFHEHSTSLITAMLTYVQYSINLEPDLPGLLGIRIRPRKLRDPVNRGTVNGGTR